MLLNKYLLDDAGDQTGSDGASTLADVEALTLLNGERLVDLADHLDVVTWHDHLGVGVLGALGPVESGGLIWSCQYDVKARNRDVATHQQYG